MRTVSVPAGARLGPLQSKRLLALASDDRLVEQIRRGNDAAFEVAFERHGPGILSFSRHMLRSHEEAEDAVQHVFASAHRDLLRDERDIRLKPWLYTIARNRCLSILRSRRETASDDHDIAVAGLDEQVQQRADLQDLLRDLRDLPEEQRAALLLAEVGDLSHAEVADILGCEVSRVKALVFRARSGLMERRRGREMPCGDIREQLANLRGGSLRRSALRHHLKECAGCRAFREDLRAQRRMLAIALPVIPSLGLKRSVLAAAGIGGGSAGGGAALGGLSALSGSFGTAGVAKLAVVGVIAGGGIVAGEKALDSPDPTPGPTKAAEAAGKAAPEVAPAPVRRGPSAQGRAHGRAVGPPPFPGKGKARGRHGLGRGPAEVPGSRGKGVHNRSDRANGVPRGRGAPQAPPKSTPVQRGPQPKVERVKPTPNAPLESPPPEEPLDPGL